MYQTKNLFLATFCVRQKLTHPFVVYVKRQKIVCGNRRPNILSIVWFLFCLGIFFFNNQQFYIFEITFIGDHQGLATDRSSANTPPRKQIKIRKYRQSQGIFNATPRKWNEMKYAFLFFMIPSLSLRLRNLYNWACRTWIMPFWYLRLCQFILNFFCSKFAALH